MESIVIGSKETLLVDLEDTLGNLTDLTGVGITYDVKDETGTDKISDADIVVQPSAPMTARCLIDTSTGTWEAGHYFLYLKFSLDPDAPILGPLEFKVNP